MVIIKNSVAYSTRSKTPKLYSLLPFKRKYRLKTEYVSSNTRSKNPILVEPLSFNNNKKRKCPIIISASKVHNYVKGDSLVDWLILRNTKTFQKKKKIETNNFNNFICEQGQKFEEEVVKYINANCIQVVKVSNYINKESLLKTKNLMKNGVPVIYSAPVYNYKNKTQGIVDLLVRSDYLHYIVENNPLKDDEISIPSIKLGTNYHYVVVDIKYSTIPLCADKIHILNSKNYPYYKSQCLIYTEAVGLIQGFTAPHAFILGRKWRCKNIVNSNFRNRLGKIDYDVFDYKYKDLTKNAINWVRDVIKHGNTWSINPPSRKELYPNMCVDSGIWNDKKNKIATEINEITKIWNVGTKHRDIALQNGISNWKDIRCNAKTLGIESSRKNIINNIISINQQDNDKIRPKIIQCNIGDWKNINDTSYNEIYVDFETFSDIFGDFSKLPEQIPTNMIFMIGVGWVENEKWNYKTFICNETTPDEELRIMNDFTKLIYSINKTKIYYWSAELSIWKTACERQLNRQNKQSTQYTLLYNSYNNIIWVDLLKLFKLEPIVIKNCFNFGLKNIAKVMKQHNMISLEIESDCTDGMTAMFNAWNCYKKEKDPINTDVMKDIIKYNQFDVRVLWEIISYLRNNHI